jgi:pectin methylesterase-like acyl-CoA thioesterase
VCASGCDYTSIKAAIAAPTTLDGDTLAIAAGTYTEAGITVNKNLTLQGEEAATTIVQAAASLGTASDRVFLIPSGATMTLAAGGELLTVSVSGWHARWVGSIHAGTLVEVTGALAGPGLVHARFAMKYLRA